MENKQLVQIVVHVQTFTSNQGLLEKDGLENWLQDCHEEYSRHLKDEGSLQIHLELDAS